MRQPGNENRVDPFQPDTPKLLTDITLSPAEQAEFKKWTLNAFLSRQHKYCANQCVSFTLGNDLS